MSDKSSSSGVSFLGMLTILFIGLKLTHFIDWSWWWVLCPMWGGAALVIAIWIITLLMTGLIAGLAALFRTRPRRPFR